MSVLSRYLDPRVLSQIAQQPFEPHGLVWGNLAGAHKSTQSGFAVEFHGHREYVPGDDPRHIDWRVYYRREKYFVKQHELETNFVCHLMLDVSASMRYGEGDCQKLLYAARAATMLAYCIIRRNDKVSLATFDRQLRWYLPPSNAWEQIVKMTGHLHEVTPTEGTDIARCAADLAPRTGRREIVIILSDFFGDLGALERAIQRLKFAHHEVVLLQVLDHDELTFPLDGMTKFIGLEMPDHFLANPTDLRQAYLASFSRFQQQLDHLAQRNASEHMVLDTSRNIGDSLTDYLNRRAIRSHRGRTGENRVNEARWLPRAPDGK
jgi:uncharacterized protein (DUF58 family)